jgi:hypothetical protein
VLYLSLFQRFPDLNVYRKDGEEGKDGVKVDADDGSRQTETRRAVPARLPGIHAKDIFLFRGVQKQDVRL